MSNAPRESWIEMPYPVLPIQYAAGGCEPTPRLMLQRRLPRATAVWLSSGQHQALRRDQLEERTR
jgi:hypothetical protein